jgi:hypothetical protein
VEFSVLGFLVLRGAVVAGAVAGSAELDVAAVLEDAVEDGLGEVGIMEDVPPGGKRLVGGEDHGLAAKVSIVVEAVAEHGEELPGAFAVIDRNRMRVRRGPS